jgi:hypothetical protein
MPLVGFELTIPALERTQAFRFLDQEATVIGKDYIKPIILLHTQS